MFDKEFNFLIFYLVFCFFIYFVFLLFFIKCLFILVFRYCNIGEYIFKLVFVEGVENVDGFDDEKKNKCVIDKIILKLDWIFGDDLF